VLEAMAAGVPVVTTPTGGLKELIRSGHNGLVLRGDSPKAWARELADALLVLLAKPGLAKAMGRRGRALAHREYRVELVSERIEGLYRAVAARTTRRAARAGLLPPVDVDRDSYTALIRRVAGSEASEAASRMPWRYGCATCTRSVLAEGQRNLVQLSTGRPPRGRVQEDGPWRIRIQAAIEAVCPVGMLQRDFLRTSEF